VLTDCALLQSPFGIPLSGISCQGTEGGMDRELWLAIAVAAIVVILILALRLTVWEPVLRG
jgi:hypothetical protein